MYRQIHTSGDPSVTGISDGTSYQVELSRAKSFVSDDERKYFNENVGAYLTTNFKNIEKSKLTKLTFFPLKKAKKTDFISYGPSRKSGLNFLVSQKVMDIFEQFTLPDYIKIPAKIEGFKNDYYAVGFPIISEDEVDFRNSESRHSVKREIVVVVNTEEEYFEKTVELVSQKLKLKSKLPPFDVIKVQEQGIFFSDKLIEMLEDEEVTGFEIYNTVLE